MASKTTEKRLSRFFKDLEEFEDETDEDVETEDGSKDEGRSCSNQTSTIQQETDEKPEDKNKTKSTNKDVDLGLQPQCEKRTQNNFESVSDKLQRLPSAHECLKTQTTPGFLKSLNKKDIDWDRLEKTLPTEDTEGTIPLDYKSNAVPPPSSYEPETDPGIKVVDSEGRKRKTTYDELEDQMSSTKAYKVHPPEEDAA